MQVSSAPCNHASSVKIMAGAWSGLHADSDMTEGTGLALRGGLIQLPSHEHVLKSCGGRRDSHRTISWYGEGPPAGDAAGCHRYIAPFDAESSRCE